MMLNISNSIQQYTELKHIMTIVTESTVVLQVSVANIYLKPPLGATLWNFLMELSSEKKYNGGFTQDIAVSILIHHTDT